ncbi:hypothetical protein LCGC14_0983930, partial [marine sediment metagenome]
MQLKGQVLGYDDIATFELSDVIGSYKEDDVLYIQTSFGETPIIYSTIESILPIQEGDESDDEILRKAGYDPDEIGAQMKAAAEAALARIALEGANGFALRARASEEMGCTCDACLDIIRDIIRKEIEDEKSGPSPIGPPNRA